jgi:soluble lytic murein transglycosylase-like protein
MRAMLSALAGGGLTAAGLGGPLALPAIAAAGTGNAAASEPGTSTQETTTGESSTSTATTPAASTTSTDTTSTETTPTTSTATTTAPTSTTTAEPTSTTPAATTPEASTPAAEAPTVVLKRAQKSTPSAATNPNATSTPSTSAGKQKAADKKTSPQKLTGANGVAASPQTIAAEAGSLAALLASSEASTQALSFYRIPLFLLPIYKAAAVQYGVPWQVLAAINEIETDYGNDLSVSTAGAVGWMQFMPSTWLQYGVDALNAGYADPYNPVDAIFAAARYLRAAGAATDLKAAILSYNHSEEYVESVLLRAKLISSYPKAVIATLTGLIDGRLPLTGKHVSWSPLATAAASTSSATAGASAVTGEAATSDGSSDSSRTPGSTPPLSPSAAAAAATSKKSSSATAEALQFVEVMGKPNAAVVAVQDGRIVKLGHSRKLGKYIVLRDVYGDVFTYADLGSIAPTYTLPKANELDTRSPVIEAASTHTSAPSQAASAGTQPAITLQAQKSAHEQSAQTLSNVQNEATESTPAGMEKRRLFAHPGNPDARAARTASAARRAQISKAGRAQPLRSGSIVTAGTVLGRVRVPAGARDGHLRFAVRPAGDPNTVAPGPVLANWAQLQRALHPEGATATNALLGATASDVFLLSKAQLERAVLSDPGVTMDACARREVAAGTVDKRVLAVLEFLSRSGLEPTVSALRCAQRQYTGYDALTAAYTGEEVDISAINGTPVAGHQGPESITELTIRTLLTLPSGFVPHEIVSLMHFAGAANTRASATEWNRIHLGFSPERRTPVLDAAAASTVAHSARSGRTAPAPVVTTSALSASQWSELMERVGTLPMPTIAAKPSSAAIPDPKHR